MIILIVKIVLIFWIVNELKIKNHIQHQHYENLNYPYCNKT
jgi:hypothetical protein